MSILRETDQIFCKHCGQWHGLEILSTGERTAGNIHAYTTCAGGHYYCGTLGTPCIHPTRQPPIWTLHKDSRVLECCLRSHGELGWEVELYRNGTFYAGRRFILHAEARAHAEQARGDCEREGWGT